MDDDPRIRDLLTRMLEASGYAAEAAEDAAEARRCLRDHEFAAILIDVRMPGESGLDLLKYVSTECINTAAVMVTAMDDPELVEMAFETGAYGYVVKPFRMSELLINVSNALHRRQLEIRNRGYIEELEEKVARHRMLHDTIAPFYDPGSAQIPVEEVIVRLSGALTMRDEETGRHIRRMSNLTSFLADRAGLRVGKIGVPDAVLLKPGPLNPEERSVMQRHTIIGHRMLSDSSSPLLQLGALIALTHHERWDGSGYPRGLAGEAIPAEGRLTAIADVFDALTNNRVYRSALEVEEAVELMLRGRGTHFDPRLLDLFISSIDDLPGVRDDYPG